MGAPIEHVDNGGEFRLKRDPDFKGTAGTARRLGGFTLNNVRDFCNEAEIAGVDPDTCVQVQYYRDPDGEVVIDYFFFPTTSDVYYSTPVPEKPRKKRPDYELLASVTIAATMFGYLFLKAVIGF